MCQHFGWFALALRGNAGTNVQHSIPALSIAIAAARKLRSWGDPCSGGRAINQFGSLVVGPDLGRRGLAFGLSFMKAALNEREQQAISASILAES